MNVTDIGFNGAISCKKGCWMPPIIGAAIGLLLFGGVATASETFTYYNAIVTSAYGPQADAFPDGEPITISYILNPSIPDSESDPQRGFFIKSVRLYAASSNLNVSTKTPGNTQSFNNVKDSSSGKLSDQVSFYIDTTTSSSFLGDVVVNAVELGFLSEFVTPPAQPTMLSDDGLPLFLLPTTDASLFLHTSLGWTQVDFITSGAAIKGTAPWKTQHTVTCINVSTGMTVKINQTKKPQWDCEKAGLVIRPGENVEVKIKGTKR